MAYVLSLPSNPLDRPFAEPRCFGSRASIMRRCSSSTTHQRNQQSQSVAWPLQEDTGRLDASRLGSRTVLNYIRDFDLGDAPPSSPSRASSIYELDGETPNIAQGLDPEGLEAGNTHESEDSTVPIPPFDALPLNDDAIENTNHATIDVPDVSLKDEAITSSPFKRWLSTLRRRHDNTISRGTAEWPDHTQSPRSGHCISRSLSSSMGFLTGVKSASLTLAGTSIAPPSRYGRQSHLNSDNTSHRGPRCSVDSTSAPFEAAIDGTAWYRSVQRRNIVEEILQSEESYISDMKAMIHVYFTLLASTPSLSPRKKEPIQKSITQIIQLHEELLAELQRVVPRRLDTNLPGTPPRLPRRSKHARWHSADNGPIGSRLIGHRRVQQSADITRPSSPISRSMVLTTNTVLNVAKVFDRFMKRFLAYEAYVAYHDIVHEEASSTSRLVPAWPLYERGVEALSSFVNAIDQKEACGRRGMTLSDLGIKPIQRICKYPLFFSDLCKHTPACDDPIVHAELEKVLSRLQETAEEIDFAMDNPQTRHLIETTWVLQDRLSFRGEPLPIQAGNIRTLGHIVLCGVLHAAYETSDQVRGRYSICVLYRSYLVLASTGSNANIYMIDAIIPLLSAAIEASDDGKGLQCHTARHTWKLFFLHEHKHYEVLFSACSEAEEDAWKNELHLRIAAEARDAAEGRHSCVDKIAHLAIGIKPAGSAFDVNIDLVRRLSIRRAATLGPRTSLRQVIIKNTHAQRPGRHQSEDSVQVSRSKSHLSSSSMPTLAPRRAERVRLETILSDVWSRDKLPYPGMAIRAPENTIRASANSVMRKLSMASIASNFSSSKRCGSFSGPNHQRGDIGRTPSPRTFYDTAARGKRLEKRRSRAAVVDFHSAPNAFLPEDFELKKPTLTMRGQNFMRRAMTMDGNRVPPQISLPGTSGAHKRSISLSVAPGSSPLGSMELGGQRTATTLQMRLNENNSPQPSVAVSKKPVKVKSRLFKLLGVNAGKD